MDLAGINDVSIFAPLVGSRFRVEAGTNRVIQAQLVEADALNTGGAKPEDVSREAFSLLFELEEDVELPQQTYRVTHDALGMLSLFLVPVGPGRMESIFS